MFQMVFFAHSTSNLHIFVVAQEPQVHATATVGGAPPSRDFRQTKDASVITIVVDVLLFNLLGTLAYGVIA